jgi:hypothetical protein
MWPFNTGDCLTEVGMFDYIYEYSKLKGTTILVRNSPLPDYQDKICKQSLSTDIILPGLVHHLSWVQDNKIFTWTCTPPFLSSR